ncbi:MAG: EpsG family protein [Oscillospiraceae bacterium]|nr:EpsG family protein [Oscillospiraceae bacterium]
MAIYITLLCSAVLPSFFAQINENEKQKKRYLIFVFTLAALAAALRGISVGADTRQFAGAYVEIGYLSWDRAFTLRYEPGFIILCKLLNFISSDYQLLFIVTSAFITFSFARFIYKNSDNIVISTVVFFCMFFAQSMNLMRQYIAVGILLFGLEFLKRKKYNRFLLFVLLAASFHYSAIVSAVYIILYRLIIKRGAFLALSIVYALIFINYRQILGFFTSFSLLSQYEGYVGSSFDVQDTETRPLKILMIILVLVFIKISGNEENEKENLKPNFHVNMLLAWGAIEMISINMKILSRFITYFDVIMLVSVSKALSRIKHKNIRIIFNFIIFLAMIGYFYVTRIRNNSMGVMPYKFFWEV